MIKVLIVDDSAVVRKILSKTLSDYKDIEVVGTAPDPYVARDLIVELKPDVITLDIEMPKMDGLTFLAKIMKHFPIPVVIVSSLTRNSKEMTIKALELGAVDVVSKPGSSFSIDDLEEVLVEKIRIASRAIIKKKNNSVLSSSISKIKIDTTQKFLAVGSSTGGTEALRVLLENLPKSFPGIVIVQHMPPGFTKSLAIRLNELCNMEVKEAEDGDSISVGRVLIAPGNYHMAVLRMGAKYIIKLNQGSRVQFQRPSVDVLFKSVAMEAGKNAIGVILTGMGADGAEGIKMMRNAQAHTIAQDEESCVVYGMPRKAVEIGGVDTIMSLYKMPEYLVSIMSKQDYNF
ncbi:MAG: chemotaxis response regulator protein-glutamate methylesterase [Candidatus Muirbacterium halophilum]|nr:chemotaxis response regulator protein-glutamate methylesterase [Candidatus Muirbacterium halophilum]MCK9477291.1 chemotaxis response regulator protein-glutamate methylesterase [Candidatus Muirbacterium halophilum]